MGVTDTAYQQADDIKGMHPGRTASILVNGVRVGYLGQVHPELQKKYDVDETYVFYLDLETMYASQVKMSQYRPLPKYPASTRDLSLLVSEQVSSADLETLITGEAGSILESVELFDVYTGDKIGQGKKSLAFALTYRNSEGTLTDKEVNEAHEKVVKALADKYQAELRS